ncbi:SLA class II histocompatibility antigen, DQ haplotype C beta chain-like [Pristis pectinata]|uniref:SLA class II histocompatibility antigen, DQ haplotype C beta chain-like n=1 Tax=Pristis pectinata TaxID=685728 RepID=UPI00223D8A93|nr:SLA class II histocompatibility antigen, DQ haplotype C beta chain-like [Pristis pectinata]
MRIFFRTTFMVILSAVVSVPDVVAMQSDMHLFHTQCECIYRGLQVDDIRLRYAYDGTTIMYYDMGLKRYVAAQSIAQAEVDRRNSESDYVASVPRRIESICDEIKQAARSSNVTLDNTAPTYTRAFTQKKLGQTYLVCTARNFFPRDIKVSWVRNGAVADHGSDTIDIVPQIDGTFQVRSVRPLNGDSSAYFCQVEHEAIGEKLLIPLEHNVSVANEALIIIGAVLGILGICAMVVTAILYYCLLKGVKTLGIHPTAKFNNQAGLCRMSTCTASVRSTESNTSNSSGSSADGLTKTST